MISTTRNTCWKIPSMVFFFSFGQNRFIDIPVWLISSIPCLVFISVNVCVRDIRDDIFIYQKYLNGFLTKWITNVHISFVKRMTWIRFNIILFISGVTFTIITFISFWKMLDNYNLRFLIENFSWMQITKLNIHHCVSV